MLLASYFQARNFYLLNFNIGVSKKQQLKKKYLKKEIKESVFLIFNLLHKKKLIY